MISIATKIKKGLKMMFEDEIKELYLLLKITHGDRWFSCTQACDLLNPEQIRIINLGRITERKFCLTSDILSEFYFKLKPISCLNG